MHFNFFTSVYFLLFTYLCEKNNSRSINVSCYSFESTHSLNMWGCSWIYDISPSATISPVRVIRQIATRPFPRHQPYYHQTRPFPNIHRTKLLAIIAFNIWSNSSYCLLKLISTPIATRRNFANGVESCQPFTFVSWPICFATCRRVTQSYVFCAIYMFMLLRIKAPV